MDAKRAPSLALVDRETFKGRFKEKCLLGRDEYDSNMHSVYYKDPSQQTLVVGMSPTDP